MYVCVYVCIYAAYTWKKKDEGKKEEKIATKKLIILGYNKKNRKNE